ncbi:tRNA-guanine(15) transglycosylase-like protein [Rhypophila decipiens]|uniref:Queuine tRNA-ribosyltransferase accessory subunit 2 n=1 Tax=Rhypophila decipiens TaxID=261697 RepID=A0AAN6Y3T4_9PEZI|nr:tRNA-guanine(15) transglycosylase-like protein [Rhypophila decipiens]
MSDEIHDQAVMTFEVLKAAVRDGVAARLGKLALAGRKTVIDTPNFFAGTSRGVVPHITPDNVSKHLHAGGAYMALEDFIERPQQYYTRKPPIFDTPTPLPPGKPLHSFTAMPPSITTVLAARRIPAVPAPMGNSNNSISIFTSVGFQVLTTKEYHNAVEALKPDIAIPLADLTNHSTAPNTKRALRMADRTDQWVKEFFDELDTQDVLNPSKISTFAPILPIDYSIQWEYIERLAEDLFPHLAGLAVYDLDVLPDIADKYANLLTLPRLSLSAPATPHHILRQIGLGIDLFTIPFINTVSDSGLALTFTFPSPSSQLEPADAQPNGTGTSLKPLGMDLSCPSNQISLAPLLENCTCYACTNHHKAYIHHLLNAREMLGWTLLQIHNHAVISQFFASIRETLSLGQEAFEAAVEKFTLTYEPDFPAGTGEKPRARGYHYKSGAGEGKRNKPGWSKLGGDETPAAEKENGNPADVAPVTVAADVNA